MVTRRIGQYEVIARLGDGGMGEVWKARDPKLQRTVAIKVLKNPSADADAGIFKEARAASALNHPHICTIHEVGHADGVSFIVMEHVEGQPLNRLIPSDGMPPEDVVRYGTQIADAVAHAHERGIVHRDLKSQNVVITPEGRAKVLDFGLAEHLPKAGTLEQTMTLEATPRTIAGTLPYMAPELLRGDAATAASDIWALGVMLHAMASGQLPFRGGTVADLTATILKTPAPPLPDLVPPGLHAITRRALAKDRGQRYANAGELRAALEAIGTSTTSRPVESPTPSESPPPSIAVLPFADMSPQRDQDYFCEGMAEEIINALTGIQGLRVAARTSSFALAGQNVDAKEIGTRLKVASVLEGSVRKAGNRLRITTQLIDVADGMNLWSERFDREMDDVFAVQDEIARAIADGLNVTLGSDADKPLVRPPTDNMEAYNAYLRGRFLLNMKGSASRQALEYYERAVGLDPEFALAHAGVADAVIYLGDQGIVEPQESVRRAKQSLSRALELDPNLVDAYVTLAWIKMLHEWDWDGAEPLFLKALEVGPNSADAHSRYACYLSWVRQRVDEAVTHARKGIELEPMSEPPVTWLGSVLLFGRRYDDAAVAMRGAVELDPSSFHAQYHLGAALRLTGNPAEAVEVLKKAMRLAEGHPWAMSELGHAYVALGERERARECLDEMIEHSGETSNWVHIATLFGTLGMLDEAFEALEHAYEAREVFLTTVRSYANFDPLRGDPRFEDLVRRMGF